MKSLVLGLTGQSGAGKTTVSNYLQKAGCAVIDADFTARLVVDKGSACIADIALEFGCEYLTIDGTLNRKKMAETVFTDRAKLKRLNAIMFPYIIQRLQEQIAQAMKEGNRIIVLDAPTLFESGTDRFCDKVVSVIAPQEVRCQRIIERDGLTEEQAMNRILSQHDDAYYTEKSWCVIRNNSTKEELEMQTENMLSRLSYLSYLAEHEEEPLSVKESI